MPTATEAHEDVQQQVSGSTLVQPMLTAVDARAHTHACMCACRLLPLKFFGHAVPCIHKGIHTHTHKEGCPEKNTTAAARNTHQHACLCLAPRLAPTLSRRMKYKYKHQPIWPQRMCVAAFPAPCSSSHIAAGLASHSA